MRYPSDPDRLRRSKLVDQWWYYTVELIPGVVARGIYPETLPMLPRILLRNCDVSSMTCLDVGTMEGLIPTLLARRGAGRVLGVDAVDHCLQKLRAVQHYHRVSFEYRSVGLMYSLDEKLPEDGFDLINCSGLLYHVFSPLHVLTGLRPLLKRNGIMIISTGVVHVGESVMEFNDRGRLQEETNTFWYISVPLLDYQLRYLKLAPIDCLYLPQATVGQRPLGYLSVVCRAVNEVVPEKDDVWMRTSAAQSWEHMQLVDWRRAERQPKSSIAYGPTDGALNYYRTDTRTLDLTRAVSSRSQTPIARTPADSHVLGLSDDA